MYFVNNSKTLITINMLDLFSDMVSIVDIVASTQFKLHSTRKLPVNHMTMLVLVLYSQIINLTRGCAVLRQPLYVDSSGSCND